MYSSFRMMHSIGGSVHWRFLVVEVSLDGDGSVRSKEGTGTRLRAQTYRLERHHHVIPMELSFCLSVRSTPMAIGF